MKVIQNPTSKELKPVSVVLDGEVLSVPHYLPSLVRKEETAKGFWEASALESFEYMCRKHLEKTGATSWTLEVLTAKPEHMYCALTNTVEPCYRVRVTFLKEELLTTNLQISTSDFEDACEVLRSNGFTYQTEGDLWFKEKEEKLEYVELPFVFQQAARDHVIAADPEGTAELSFDYLEQECQAYYHFDSRGNIVNKKEGNL